MLFIWSLGTWDGTGGADGGGAEALEAGVGVGISDAVEYPLELPSTT